MRAAEFFQRCLDAGMPTNMALTAMRAFEAEVEIVIDLTLEKQRAPDRARTARYRSRGGGNIPPELRAAVMERDGYECLACSTPDNLCCDHVVPVSKGGPTTFDNLQTLCIPCNSRKKDRERKYEKRRADCPKKSADIGGSSAAKDAPAPVHTRGENNPSNLDTTGFAVVAAVEARDPGFDWPAGKAADHAKILVRVTASPWLDPAKQQQLVTTTGRLEAWRRDGASWEHDVVPVVTTLARARGSPIRTWKFFDPAVAQSIADNRRALVIPAANGHRHERPDQPSAKLAAKQANMERAAWGAQSAAARRAV